MIFSGLASNGTGCTPRQAAGVLARGPCCTHNLFDVHHPRNKIKEVRVAVRPAVTLGVFFLSRVLLTVTDARGFLTDGKMTVRGHFKAKSSISSFYFDASFRGQIMFRAG